MAVTLNRLLGFSLEDLCRDGEEFTKKCNLNKVRFDRNFYVNNFLDSLTFIESIHQDDPQKLQSMNIKPYSMKDGIDFGQQWRSKSFQEKLEAIESLDYLGHRNLKKLTQPYRESVILYEKNKSLHNPKR